MRFETAQFDGFAGLQGRRDFDPGLNVIVGPNEAGKSRLIAGLLFGLCGRVKKRGKGLDPAERYRPWANNGATHGSSSFRMAVTIRLANGHLIEVNQNLDEPSRSRMVDVGLGRDLTADHMVDRSPDASRLLGLDREVVPRTLVVHQTELLSVRQGADAMQMMLQRAATRGALDETANSALARLEAFRSERIGTEHPSSKKPLKTTRDLETTTRRTLDELRDLHQNLGEQRNALIHQRSELEATGRQREVAKARELAHELERLERLLSRIQNIDAELHSLGDHSTESPPPLSAEAFAGLENNLAGLRLAGPPESPSTPAPDLLQSELDRLPQVPTGDLSPRPEIASLNEDHILATRAREAHLALRPGPVAVAAGLEPHVLREHARVLEQSAPTVPDLPAGLDPRGPRLAAAIALTLGLLAVGLGAGLGVLLALVLGLIAIGAGVVLAVVARRRQRQGESRLAERRAREADLALFVERRQHVERALTQSGIVDATPDKARAAAAAHESALDAQRLQDQWTIQTNYLENRDNLARQRLAAVLASVSATSWTDYVDACNQRSRTEAQARRRTDLERLLSTSIKEHETYRSAVLAYETRVEQARRDGQTLGVEVLDGKALDAGEIERIEARLRAVRSLHDAQTRSRQLVAERSSLLGSDDLDRLTQRGTALRAQVARADTMATPTALSALELDVRIAELQRTIANNEATLNERLRGMPSIAEAEEALDLATREHARFRRLDRLVAVTMEHLQAARDNIHRDIAPRLSKALSEVVPQLTGGRWERARISVDDLSVAVFRDHEWRSAHELSCGTAEQIYLALRVVLARELALPEEPPPFILDDVFVHADSDRVEELKAWVLDLAASHQVILTTADERLIPWAQASGAKVHRFDIGGQHD